MPMEASRVVTPDVGGGFGMKIFLYAEQPLVLLAARDLGRPVKWTAERSADDFVRSDEHTSELQSPMRLSFVVFCSNKKLAYSWQMETLWPPSLQSAIFQ